MKRVAGVFLKLAAFLVVLLVVFVAINLYDRGLDVEVVEIIEARPEPVPDDLNSYFSILGFQAGPGEDIREVGRRMVDVHEAAVAGSPPPLRLSVFDDVPGSTDMEFSTGFVVYCDFEEEACLARYEASGDSLAQGVSANRELLDRYRSLYAYDYFQRPMTPSLLEPFTALGAVFFPLHGLVMGEIASRFLDGDHAAALRDLETDILFWRRLAGAADNFSEKRDAHRFLRAGYALLGEMMTVLTEVPADFEPDPTLFEPLTGAERSFEPVWNHALRSFAWALDNGRWPLGGTPGSEISLVWGFLIKENATLNDAHDVLSGWTDISEMSPEEYEAVEEDLVGFGSEVDEGLGLGLSWVYNPGGKLITRQLEVSILNDLLVQSHDVDARIARAAEAVGR